MSAVNAVIFMLDRRRYEQGYIDDTAELIFRDLVSHGPSTKREIFERVDPVTDRLGWLSIGRSIDSFGVKCNEEIDEYGEFARDNANYDGVPRYWLYFVERRGGSGDDLPITNPLIQTESST
jgi:hypothetical protein